MSAPPRYRIIYNWDGGPHGYSEMPQSMEAFLEKVYAPLADTQVGALFWSAGQHAAHWNSETLEKIGDVHGRRYENVQNCVFVENLRAMLERGEDPQEAIVARGRAVGLHVYASVRMNDNHFNGAQVKDLPGLHHTELTRRRIDHPEWLLGDRTPEWFALSWNMAVPEVREYRLAHIEEVCRRYDWDGVELDWQRHAFHLPQDEAYRLRYVLTDLQRAVRRMTETLSRERGKPFYLAARVAGSLEMCRHIGYDIPAWVDEGLVDLLIPAGGAATDPSLEVDRFVEVCRGRGIAVYPGFDGGLPDPFVGPEDARTKDRMRTRAIASRYHGAGADGIYVFNWHANRETRRELLCQVGAPETLRRTDKIHAATHRFTPREGEWRGAYDNDRIWGEVPVALKRTFTGDGPEISLEIAEDLVADRPERLELRIRLDQWVKGDDVRVLWDGMEKERPEVRYCTLNDPHRLSDVSSAVWLCWRMEVSEVATGSHAVKVVLIERHPQVASDIVLTDVELVIAYGTA
ncbi:MAG: hypothetical protein EXS64_18590 [Candidatus Latescibacteria bacterium]|nr:hypothetical protein [Candidatus Latescibacterota bacterium]